MDGERFDNLTRKLASGVSRRAVLKAVLGSAAGGALAAAGRRPALAQHCGHPGQDCTTDLDCCGALPCIDRTCQPPHGQPSQNCPAGCADGEGCCGGTCTDLTSPSNCGGCGNTCSTSVANASATCVNEACGYSCNAGFRQCADGSCAPVDGCCGDAECANLNDDCHAGKCLGDACQAVPANVGDQCANNDACVTGTVCQTDGSCGGGTPVTCDDGDPCTIDRCDPETGCVSTPVACAAGQTCIGGACVCTPESCPDGCCFGPSCEAGTSLNFCGVGGNTCQTCGSDAQCCDGACLYEGCCTISDCTDNQVCFEHTCQAGCVINGSLVAPHALNPQNDCQVCEPAFSTTGWSQRRGASCGSGDFTGECCASGACCSGSTGCTCCSGSGTRCSSPNSCHPNEGGTCH